MKELKKVLVTVAITLTAISASAHESDISKYVCGVGETYAEALADLTADMNNGVHEGIAKRLLKEEGIDSKNFGFGMDNDYNYEEISYRKDPNGPVIATALQVCNWLEVTLPSNN